MADDSDDPVTGQTTPFGTTATGFVGRVREDDGREYTATFETVGDDEQINPDTYVVLGDQHEDGTVGITFPHRTRGKGPAKVNSQAFRDGWDRIFGKTTPGEA